MATVEKIRRDIEKTREKISEQQKRLRALEAQLTEEENLEPHHPAGWHDGGGGRGGPRRRRYGGHRK